ncbi:MAG: MmcQ/YjbR family DNA-binding protein [Polyangiaceae bacterium]
MSKPRTPADVAYEKVRDVCLRFPGAEEKLSHGMPSFHVRGKMFAYFIDNHHGGDQQIAVWCKATIPNQKRLVSENSARFFVPPYVGVKGWVGVDVNPSRADWIELAMLVEESWMAIAPPKLVSGEMAPPKLAKKAPLTRVTTSDKIAEAALEKLTEICLSLPEAERNRETKHATFRVNKKVFAYFLDNHHGDGIVSVCVKGEQRANARLVAKDSKRFYMPAYIGSRGYVGIRLDTPRVDWKDITTRIVNSWRATALKKLLAAHDKPKAAKAAKKKPKSR